MLEKEVLCIDMDDVTADLNITAMNIHNKDNPDRVLVEEDLNCWYKNWDLLISREHW